jgi:fructokinase
VFFFEKKNQKTFALWRRLSSERTPYEQKSFASFLQKRRPFFFVQGIPRVAQPSYDILGIGNAIVDVVSAADHAFLTRHDMHPGSMQLIDAARADALYAVMPERRETSGGSAANTCAVAAHLGARVAFIGKVADDALGHAFRRDIAAMGVHFPSAPLQGGAPTARCLILVTPDAQRTMNTYLGACVAFGEHDVDTRLVAESAITYLEGYLFDPPAAQAAFRLAAHTARQAGRQVALSLSDAFCVNRHRAAFIELLGEIDILFANEAEICSLFEVNDFAAAVDGARNLVPLAALTQSEAGSTIVRGAETVRVQAAPTHLVDSTGAGDAYAAGFLAAYTKGQDLAACGQLASAAAAEIISHYGARPERKIEVA